jgi:hypothetical protein
MKKSENDPLIERVEDLMKMMNWKIENLMKMMNWEVENLMKINHSDHHSRDRFRIFSYRWKKFLACHQIHTKMTVNDDRTKVIYREREARRLHYDQVLDFSIHHFHQVLDLPDQKIVFGFFHTDGKFSLHVIRCMRNLHWTMIVDIIESDVMIEVRVREKKRWVLISILI